LAFNVQIDGARYLARVTSLHKTKKEMVWFKFAQAGYGDEAFAPLTIVSKWLVSDEEALDPKTDWYEDPEDKSDLESEPEDAPQRGQGRAPRQSDEPRGVVKNGRWQPAQAPRTEHESMAATATSGTEVRMYSCSSSSAC
jgi:hypothetical protein